LLSNNGVSACLLTSWNVGAMIKNVKNIANPSNTWFGGTPCVPIDVLTNERTIIILVKQVVNINTPGATDNTVNNNKSFTEDVTVSGLLEFRY
jgi:hypothetical protein